MLVKFLHFLCENCVMAWKEVDADSRRPDYQGACPRCNVRRNEPVDRSEKEVPNGR